MKITRRNLPLDSLEVRTDQEGQKSTIVGHAAVFDSFSESIGGMFIERIKPGAFARALREKQDVRALFNHDPNFVLGRTASGTLRLSEDQKGLSVEIEPPDTAFARDLITSIQRGDVSQMSFGFRAKAQRFIEGGGPDGEDVRELEDVDLFDVSPVTFPAYEDTDVDIQDDDGARSYREWRSKLTEENENTDIRPLESMVREQKQAETSLTL